jgi:hypothetical protein
MLSESWSGVTWRLEASRWVAGRLPYSSEDGVPLELLGRVLRRRGETPPPAAPSVRTSMGICDADPVSAQTGAVVEPAGVPLKRVKRGFEQAPSSCWISSDPTFSTLLLACAWSGSSQLDTPGAGLWQRRFGRLRASVSHRAGSRRHGAQDSVGEALGVVAGDLAGSADSVHVEGCRE